MNLKQIDFNSEIVLARILNLVKPFFEKIVKIEFKNELYKLFLKKNALIAPKQDCPNLLHNKSKWNKLNLFIWITIQFLQNKFLKFFILGFFEGFFLLTEFLKRAFCAITFAHKHQLK